MDFRFVNSNISSILGSLINATNASYEPDYDPLI